MILPVTVTHPKQTTTASLAEAWVQNMMFLLENDHIHPCIAAFLIASSLVEDGESNINSQVIELGIILLEPYLLGLKCVENV